MSHKQFALWSKLFSIEGGDYAVVSASFYHLNYTPPTTFPFSLKFKFLKFVKDNHFLLTAAFAAQQKKFVENKRFDFNLHLQLRFDPPSWHILGMIDLCK